MRQFTILDTSVYAYRYGTGLSGSKVYSASKTIDSSDGAYYSTFVGTIGATSGTGANLSDGTYNLPCKIISLGLASATEINYEFNFLTTVVGGVATFLYPLQLTYSLAKLSQIITAAPCLNITINPGVVLSALAWNGSIGGELYLHAADYIRNRGLLNLVSKGFRGGAGAGNSNAYLSIQGESWSGVGVASGSPNNSGGGGGRAGTGGGDHASGAGGNRTGSLFTESGALHGTANMQSMLPGGGGGGFSRDTQGSDGTSGGGMLDLIARRLLLSEGSIDLGSSAAVDATAGGSLQGNGATGAGGSANLRAQIVDGLNSITSVGATNTSLPRTGEGGVTGRVNAVYSSKVVGESTPTSNKVLDGLLADPGGAALLALL